MADHDQSGLRFLLAEPSANTLRNRGVAFTVGRNEIPTVGLTPRPGARSARLDLVDPQVLPLPEVVLRQPWIAGHPCGVETQRLALAGLTQS